VGNASTAITASLLDNNLQVAITNIMGDASTEVLASPQVSTLDNTEALVFMGDKVSIRVIDDSGESSTQLVETGIKLTVTPHVSGDNRILLDLHPENNSYGYDEKGQVVISTQEAKTKVVVADGETVVIGGLTRNENTEKTRELLASSFHGRQGRICRYFTDGSFRDEGDSFLTRSNYPGRDCHIWRSRNGTVSLIDMMKAATF
jgi:Flp pilus assembly secretin CpaC